MKPIPFNTEMVRAILDDRKSVTRRVVKPQPPATSVVRKRSCAWEWSFWADCDMGHLMSPPCQPGDILWVRETWCKYDKDHVIDGVKYAYKADATQVSDEIRKQLGYRWRPSIHMPREAARLFLRVTDVRVERLWDITDDQCEAEGVVGWTKDGKLYKYAPADSEGDGPAWKWQDCPTTPQEAMRRVWNATVKPADLPLYGWAANPWVWVIEFERISKDEALGGGVDD